MERITVAVDEKWVLDLVKDLEKYTCFEDARQKIVKHLKKARVASEVIKKDIENLATSIVVDSTFSKNSDEVKVVEEVLSKKLDGGVLVTSFRDVTREDVEKWCEENDTKLVETRFLYNLVNGCEGLKYCPSVWIAPFGTKDHLHTDYGECMVHVKCDMCDVCINGDCWGETVKGTVKYYCQKCRTKYKKGVFLQNVYVDLHTIKNNQG